MNAKKMLVPMMALLLAAFISSACSNSRVLQPDTPANTAWLMKLAIDDNDYDRFNDLFSEGRKNTVSKDRLAEFRKITTAVSSYSHYELIEFENGEMLLARLTPERIGGKYYIEDVTRVPSNAKLLFQENKEADEKQEAQEHQLSKFKEKSEEQQKQAEEREKHVLELIERLPGIRSLGELVDAYRAPMDGAASEGYGHRLAMLTEEEGLGKLIQALSQKDESIIEDVTYLLFCEYSIKGQYEKVESAIKELEAMDIDSMDIGRKGIALNLLAEAYFSKSKAYQNK